MNSPAMDLALEEKLRQSVRGVAQTFLTSRGLSFSRLPAWTYETQQASSNIRKMAERLSGARFEIETEATQITLTYRSLRDSSPEFNWIAGPSTISITTSDFEHSISHTNGDLRVWKGMEVAEIVDGEDSIAVFSLSPTSTARFVQIWLPQNCPIEVINLEANADWKPAQTTHQPRWVHYGSSISHCEDADSPIGVWPVAVARKLGLDLYNLAMSGCANLEQFAARTIRDLPADLISLKVGINIVNGANHTATTFAPAVHGFLDTIREGNSTAKILVISPICCPAHENNPGPSSTNADGKIEGQQFSEMHSWIGELTLREIRKSLEEIVAARALADPNIFYLDGLKLFNEVEAQSLPDGIHPDAAGYLKIADNFIQNYPRAWLA
ncbi:MAG: hypothetical protein RL228_735 [Actinomycetota bacterium]